MILSMTGFGKANTQVLGTSYSVEIKSLNSKQLDLSVRIPQYFKEKEINIRKIAQQNLIRGKVDIYIHAEQGEEATNHVINKEIFEDYSQQIKNIGGEIDSTIIAALLKLPNAMKVEAHSISEDNWKMLIDAVQGAMDNLNKFRQQEGKAMEQDFMLRIEKISQFNKEVEAIADTRIEKIKTRIEDNLKKLNDIDVDKGRLEQEIIYYIEKLDITEENVRLANHCHYFVETLQEDMLAKGKKLNFIAQEIGREVNTIGSKSNDAPMQKMVVQMKDELEKIKEQLNNVL